MTYLYRLALSAALLVTLLPPASARAQSSCVADGGVAADTLDNGQLRYSVYNNGNLFFRTAGLYEVPAGSGNGSIYASSLWVGGKVDGELRVSAATYSDWPFRPGPLGSDGQPAAADCAAYDAIWTVSHADIDAFVRGEAEPEDLLTWPAELGAPYLDRDGEPGYNPREGDLPLIRGDRMAWWVMNDVAGTRHAQDAPPVGVEARVSTWVHEQEGVAGLTSFYRYEITYRGDVPLDSAYLALFADHDIGGATDDYSGSDSTLHLVYGYNGDASDERYGDHPPAVGYVILEGPEALPGDGLDNDRDGVVDEAGETLGLSFVPGMLKDNTNIGMPHTPVEYYDRFQAVWRDGSPMTAGGYGRGFSEERARFFMSGEPGEFWSAGYWDEQGNAATPSDWRLSGSVGPFRMEPGQTEVLEFAIVWSRDEAATVDPHYASVAKLKLDAAHVLAEREALAAVHQDRYDAYPMPDTEAGDESVPPLPARIDPPAPNPTPGATTLRVTLPGAEPGHVDVYDLLGRRVMRVEIPAQRNVEQRIGLDLSAHPAGVYVWRVVVPGAGVVRTGTVVKL